MRGFDIRQATVSNKKIHQKVLCASLVGIKTMNILPAELIGHIIGDINDLLYFYVIKDAISHGWTYETHTPTKMLFPPKDSKCHGWTFQGIKISFDGSYVPHWIFDTEARRDIRQKEQYEIKRVKIFGIFINKDGYPDWIED